MKYTEEEFYGNTQNTVLGNGEVVPLNNNEGGVHSPKIAITILLTFVKTFVALVGIVFYIMSVLITLAPTSGIKMFDYIGAEKISLFCYERIYEKDKTLANLYNVVQKSIQNKDHEKTSKYIKEMQQKSDYIVFCLKVNTATLKVTEKEYVAFVGDLDGYLVSQNIIAEYNSGNEQRAADIARLDLKNANLYSFGLSTFIECLENDESLTDKQINYKILEVVNLTSNSTATINLIKSRRSLVDVSNTDGSLNDKILRVYTSLKIENVLHRIYTIQGEEGLKNQTAQNIKNLQAEYDDLIK